MLYLCYSEREMELTMHLQNDLNSGLTWCGLSGRKLGILPPCEGIDLPLSLVTLHPGLQVRHGIVQNYVLMRSFAKLQSPPLSVHFFCSCDKVYHKQKVCFLLYTSDFYLTITITLIVWIIIDHVLWWMIKIDSWGIIRSLFTNWI